MTEKDKSHNTQDSTTETLPPLAAVKLEQDWLLAEIVRLANNFGLEFGITLNIGGSLVTGTVISGDTYFEEMALSIEGDVSKENRDENSFETVMAEFFRGWKSLVVKSSDVANANNGPRYIHLRDAKVFIGGNTIVPSSSGFIWRSRISLIDGFNFGSLVVG